MASRDAPALTTVRPVFTSSSACRTQHRPRVSCFLNRGEHNNSIKTSFFLFSGLQREGPPPASSPPLPAITADLTTATTSTPEPASLSLLAAGLFGLGI